MPFYMSHKSENVFNIKKDTVFSFEKSRLISIISKYVMFSPEPFFTLYNAVMKKAKDYIHKNWG